MKKFFIIVTLIILCTPKSIAHQNFKTFSPIPRHYNYFNGNKYNQYLPPPPPTNNNRWYRHRNNPNNYYNYNNPYYGYYQPRNSIFSSLKNLFDKGNMTGYTPAYNSAFENIPYDYQNSNGDYYIDNYDIQNNSTIKILD